MIVLSFVLSKSLFEPFVRDGVKILILLNIIFEKDVLFSMSWDLRLNPILIGGCLLYLCIILHSLLLFKELLSLLVNLLRALVKVLQEVVVIFLPLVVPIFRLIIPVRLAKLADLLVLSSRALIPLTSTLDKSLSLLPVALPSSTGLSLVSISLLLLITIFLSSFKVVPSIEVTASVTFSITSSTSTDISLRTSAITCKVLLILLLFESICSEATSTSTTTTLSLSTSIKISHLSMVAKLRISLRVIAITRSVVHLAIFQSTSEVPLVRVPVLPLLRLATPSFVTLIRLKMAQDFAMDTSTSATIPI